MPSVPADPHSMEWIDRLRDGRLVRIRALEPADAGRERRFLDHLPPEFRAYRFLGLIRDASDRVARELTHVDAACEVALAAFADAGGDEVEIGAAWFATNADGSHCDCAVTVDPAWQKCGVGSLLMRRLIEVARGRGVRRMYAADAARCAGAHTLAERLGFHSRPDPEDPLVTTFELALD